MLKKTLQGRQKTTNMKLNMQLSFLRRQRSIFDKIMKEIKPGSIAFSKKLHLVLSSFIVILVGFIYGVNPGEILSYVFGFEVESLELKNIFRASMGLYLAIGIFWIVGILKPKYWQTATLTNIIFMGGLAFGRIVSTVFDGVSPQFTVGLVLELFFMFWGIYNLNTSVKDKTAN